MTGAPARDFRKLWISRINAAARANGITYNRLIQGLKAAGIEVDRKNLSEIAISDPAAFTALVEAARAALPEDERPSGEAATAPLSERSSTVTEAVKLQRRATRIAAAGSPRAPIWSRRRPGTASSNGSSPPRRPGSATAHRWAACPSPLSPTGR